MTTGARAARSPVRLVATDLDGTLLRSDGTVSRRTVAALQAAEAAGILVVFVTGRPPRWLHEVADATGHTGVAVAANGAVSYDLHTDSVVESFPLEPDALLAIAGAIRDAFPAVSFAAEYGLGFASEPGYRHDWDITPVVDRAGNRLPDPQVLGLDALLARPAVKLLAKDRGADPDRFMTDAADLLAGRASVTHSSRSGLLEIAAPGVTKATGLERVAAAHGIGPEQMVAVGDMPNDVPMLAWVPRSYAVANAHPAARAAAAHQLPSNDDDAVAGLIETILAGR